MQNRSHAVMSQRVEAHEIVSRAEAKALGLLRYFTGAPCKNGHFSERAVVNCCCLECVRTNPKKIERETAYYQANCEAVKARVRARWLSDPDARAKDKASRDKRRDKIRAYDRMRVKRDREKKIVILNRWIANNPERHRELNAARSHRRRARERDAAGSFNADDVHAMFAAQKGKCWWCVKLIKGKYHVDHRIPLAKGGTNDPGNIVIACIPCNKSKSAKMPWEFAGRLL